MATKKRKRVPMATKKKKRVPIEPASEPTDTAPTGTEIIARPAALPAERSVDDLLARVNKIHDIQNRVMKEKVHYGVIPGTEKPTLYKAGAEILSLTFNLDPEFESVREADSEHLTVYSECTLYHQGTGSRLGSANACCSTKEQRYAFRNAARTCPNCRKESIIKGKAEYGGGWLCWRNKGGCGEKFADNDPSIITQQVGQVPNPNIADCYNTVIKMADIRAYRAAILFVTGASDVFTVDMEHDDDPAVRTVEPELEVKSQSKQQSKPEPKKPPQDKQLTTLTKVQTELYEAIKACVNKLNLRLREMNQTELKGENILVELTKNLSKDLRQGTRSVHRLNDNQARIVLKKLEVKEDEVETFLANQETALR